MKYENLFIRATRHGSQEPTEINLADALKLLGILDAANIAHFDLVAKDENGCEVSSQVDGEGVLSAGIDIEGVNEAGKVTGLVRVSLPSEGCPHIVTEVLCGDGDTEDLDHPVLVRVVDCVRDEGDKSLRKVYYDSDVVSATGFNTERDQSKLNASTVNEYTRSMKK